MKTPAPQEIIKTRNAVRITQTEAAALVGVCLRTWQGWEAGTTKMRAVYWETFKERVKNHG